MKSNRDPDAIRRQQERSREAARRMEARARESRKRAQERRRRDEKPRTPQDPLKRREAARSKPAPEKVHAKARIAPRSAKGKADDARWKIVSREVLAQYPECQHCIELRRQPLPSDQVHHTAGKVGEMRFDRRFLMAVAGRCHTIYPDSIHEDTAESHRRGWMLSRDAPFELKLAELIEKRGDWPHVMAEIEK